MEKTESEEAMEQITEIVKKMNEESECIITIIKTE